MSDALKPVLARVAAGAILNAGTEAEKQALLPGIAAGCRPFPTTGIQTVTEPDLALT